MKNILFPTNFSEASYKAFEYALEYAKKSNSKITIYHSYVIDNTTTKETIALYSNLDIENFQNKKDVFPPFEKIIDRLDARDIKIKTIVDEGPFISSLKAYVARKEDKIDLIILGMHDSPRNLLDLFVETDTIRVLEEINKPVIVISEKANFDGTLDNIVFLVDYKEDEKSALLDMAENMARFNAKLHVVHFDLAHGESIVPLMEKYKESLHLANMSNVEFVTIDSINLRDSLASYYQENEIDMVCLINHNKNFYQRLFSYSLTEELINHLEIPIMAIYRD